MVQHHKYIRRDELKEISSQSYVLLLDTSYYKDKKKNSDELVIWYVMGRHSYLRERHLQNRPGRLFITHKILTVFRATFGKAMRSES